ncbi:Histone chaperone asf1 [Elasticomyces elasticus]|nr:Histone chaperone asf1 [Elasticomyces elasticus]
MAAISLLNVSIRNNPAPITDKYELEVTFEALESLRSDVEWKLTYVGSATSSEHDQELDSLLVGPIPVGVNKFVFEADAPNLSKIPDSEILGVTVMLLTGSYDDREFVRVGYYVNNEYVDQALNDEPPAKPIIEKVRRNILAEKPRVTRFAIKWDSEESAPAEYPPEQLGDDAVEDDGATYGASEEEDDEDDEAVENGAVKAPGEDEEMAGADDGNSIGKEEDEVSDAGSEDLEAESSGSEDEEDEEGEGEGEGEAEDDMEMDEAGESHDAPVPVPPMVEQQPRQHQADVMVH